MVVGVGRGRLYHVAWIQDVPPIPATVRQPPSQTLRFVFGLLVVTVWMGCSCRQKVSHSVTRVKLPGSRPVGCSDHPRYQPGLSACTYAREPSHPPWIGGVCVPIARAPRCLFPPPAPSSARQASKFKQEQTQVQVHFRTCSHTHTHASTILFFRLLTSFLCALVLSPLFFVLFSAVLCVLLSLPCTPLPCSSPPPCVPPPWVPGPLPVTSPCSPPSPFPAPVTLPSSSSSCSCGQALAPPPAMLAALSWFLLAVLLLILLLLLVWPGPCSYFTNPLSWTAGPPGPAMP